MTSFSLVLAGFSSALLWFRRTPQFLWAFCLFIASVVAKSLLVEQQFPLGAHQNWPDHLWLVTNLLCFFGILWALFGRNLIWGCLVAQLAISIVYLGDLLYGRYFGDALSLYLWSGGWQVGSLWPSIRELLQPGDAWLLADLPVWLALGLRLERTSFERQVYSIVSLLVVGILGHGFYFATQDAARQHVFFKRFRNLAIVERAGLFNYHIYDIYQSLESNLIGLGSWEGDRAKIDELVAKAHRSVSQPSPYAGLLEGKNLIIIQLESLQSFACELEIDGREVMPYTKALLDSSLTLELYDQSHHGRSSDGEFCMLNGLHPPPTRPLCFSYADNQFGGLVRLLKEAGYATSYALPYSGTFWNAQHMSGQYGFAHQWFDDELGAAYGEDRLGWGMRDQVLFERVLDRLDQLKRPFFCYVVTLGGHHPYEEAEEFERELNLDDSELQKMTQDYLECCRYRDHAVRYLVEEMKSRGLFEDTVLLLVGDHDSRIPEGDFPKMGREAQVLEDKVTAIFVSPSTEWPDQPKPALAGQIDLSPTMMHLFGLPASYPFLGWNVLTEPRTFVVSRAGYGIVADQGWLRYGSWDSGVESYGVAEPEPWLKLMRAELEASQGLLQMNLLGTKPKPSASPGQTRLDPRRSQP